MRTLNTLLLVVAAALAGCNKPAPAPVVEEKPSLEVQAPGVDVNVKPGEGVQVEAPGVDVDAKAEPPK
jgi:hypothetical protein